MSAAAGGTSEPLAWAAVLHAGLCRLRLAPDLFWRLTPIELAAATGAFAPETAAPARRDLAALIAAFPDDTGSAAALMKEASPSFTGEWE